MMCKINKILARFYFKLNTGLIFDDETKSEICGKIKNIICYEVVLPDLSGNFFQNCPWKFKVLFKSESFTLNLDVFVKKETFLQTFFKLTTTYANEQKIKACSFFFKTI